MADTVVHPCEPDFVAFVGIDWGDQKHCWKLMVAGAQTIEAGELKQTPEELSSWALALHHRFGGRPIAVALEQSRGALVYQLSQYPHLWLYPVNPAAAACYRQAFYPSGSKSDPGDSKLLLELVVHHRDRLRRSAPETAETRLLRMLVEQRRQLVNEKTRWNNRLKAALKTYFPQVLEWIDIDTVLGCDLLERWPTLQLLQRAHPGTLRKFFREHNCRSASRLKERVDLSSYAGGRGYGPAGGGIGHRGQLCGPDPNTAGQHCEIGPANRNVEQPASRGPAICATARSGCSLAAASDCGIWNPTRPLCQCQ